MNENEPNVKRKRGRKPVTFSHEQIADLLTQIKTQREDSGVCLVENISISLYLVQRLVELGYVNRVDTKVTPGAGRPRKALELTDEGNSFLFTHNDDNVAVARRA